MKDYTLDAVKNLELLELVKEKGLDTMCLRNVNDKDLAIQNLQKLNKQYKIYHPTLLKEILREPKVVEVVNKLSKYSPASQTLSQFDSYLKKYGADFEDTDFFAMGLSKYGKLPHKDVPDNYLAFDMKLFLYLSDSSIQPLIYQYAWCYRQTLVEELSESENWEWIKKSALKDIPCDIVLQKDFKHFLKELEVPGVLDIYHIFRDCSHISFTFHIKRDYTKAAELCKKIVITLKDMNINMLENVCDRLSEIDLNERLMHGFLHAISPDMDKSIFLNDTSFLVACTGNRYLSLSEKITQTDDIRILFLFKYAIRQNKKAFLKLLDDEIELFEQIPHNSILYMQDFLDICNLNTLSKKDIETLFKKDEQGYLYQMHRCKMKILAGKQRTFNEIITVGMKNHKIQEIYSLLDDSFGVDEKLRRIRQLFHETMEWDSFTDVEDAAKALSRIPFMDFRDRYKELSLWDCFKLFVLEEKEPLVNGLLKEAQSVNDVQIILNNPENQDLYKIGLSEFKKRILELDCDSQWLSRKIRVEGESYRDFCLQGNAAIVHQYYDSVEYDQQRKNILLIAKAAVYGKLEYVKYQNFSEEIAYPFSEAQKEIWKSNLQLQKKDMSVAEYSDFGSCMKIGEEPGHTCMSYRNGVYNECLLSIFDANKKVVYVKDAGKIVGRAIIRITKITKNVNALGFEDVDADSGNTSEKLVVFLEKCYANGFSGKTLKRIHQLLFELAKKKAELLQAKLLIANNYEELAVQNQFKRLSTNVYISRSKNGKQYLDSLGGNCEKGGYYKKGDFYTI